MRPSTPRPIRNDDKIANFRSGVAELDEWIFARSLSNEHRGISRTMVSIDEDTGEIAGFYSLSAWAIGRSTVSGWLARNSPDPIPVILLGQLATSLDARGIQLGEDLLTQAVRAAYLAAEVLGARALVAEAINDSAASFYLYQGFKKVPGRANLYALPLKPSN